MIQTSSQHSSTRQKDVKGLFYKEFRRNDLVPSRPNRKPSVAPLRTLQITDTKYRHFFTKGQVSRILSVADLIVDVAGAAIDLYKGDYVGAGLNLAGAVVPGVPGFSLKAAYTGGTKLFASAAKTAATEARGGTYLLCDPVTGEVMRTGRSNDLLRRAAEHGRDPALRDFQFEPVHRTDVYSQQRGLEQVLHETHNPPLTKVNPISPTNPNRPTYLDAAQQFLQGGNP